MTSICSPYPAPLLLIYYPFPFVRTFIEQSRTLTLSRPGPLNPRVGGSIPPGLTSKNASQHTLGGVLRSWGRLRRALGDRGQTGTNPVHARDSTK